MSVASPPILLLFFNRPAKLASVFSVIKQVKPKVLYLACDGARDTHPEDIIKIKKCQNIVSNIDWKCSVKKLYRKENRGTQHGLYDSISWFFKNEKAGIVLEDDCFPSFDFFPFCKQMLAHFKDNHQVYHINGSNFYMGKKKVPYSYYFSKRNESSGWASWSRAWQKLDISLSPTPTREQKINIKNGMSNFIARLYYKKKWAAIRKGKIKNSWDYQWLYTILAYDGLTITPTKNLISNIGFDQEGTNTKKNHSIASMLPTQNMDTRKIIHPPKTNVRTDLDRHVFFLIGFAINYTGWFIRLFKRRLYRNKYSQ